MVLMEKVYRIGYIYPMAELKNKKNQGKAEEQAAKTKAVQVKSGDPRDSLAKKLRSLIPRLDTQCLSFLIEQAEVYLYNAELEELNKTLMKKQGAKKRNPPAAKMRIEGSESGSSYYLVYNNQWVMFSREEIIAMVNIVSVKDTDLEIRDRLFSWFERERRDVFSVLPMKDKFDEGLKKIVALFKETFRVRYQ
jgi:hypothetical protein